MALAKRHRAYRKFALPRRGILGYLKTKRNLENATANFSRFMLTRALRITAYALPVWNNATELN